MADDTTSPKKGGIGGMFKKAAGFLIKAAPISLISVFAVSTLMGVVFASAPLFAQFYIFFGLGIMYQ